MPMMVRRRRGAWEHININPIHSELRQRLCRGFWKKSGKNQLIITLLPAGSFFPAFIHPCNFHSSLAL